jgi:hypothetical protein
MYSQHFAQAQIYLLTSALPYKAHEILCVLNTPPPNHYFLACISTDMGGDGNIVGRNTFASHVYTHINADVSSTFVLARKFKNYQTYSTEDLCD